MVVSAPIVICKFASLVRVSARESFGVDDCLVKIFGERVYGIWDWGNFDRG